jgi:hypothetical protein
VPAHDAQQGVFADRQHQPPRQRGRRSTTQGYAEMMDDRLQPRGAPSRSTGHRVAELLGEMRRRQLGSAQRNRRTAMRI